MPWNGIGTFVLDPAFSPEVNGNIIDAVRYNGLFNDLAVGLTAALAKNGENVPTANLPMGGYKHTGAAPGAAAGQYATWEQITGLGIALGVIPQNSKSTAYTLVLGDAGKHLYHPASDTTARTWTIPANSSVAFAIGTAITFINDGSAGTITISITTDTLVLAGSGSTGNRTLAPHGVATAVKVTATKWYISGTGLT